MAGYGSQSPPTLDPCRREIGERFGRHAREAAGGLRRAFLRSQTDDRSVPEALQLGRRAGIFAVVEPLQIGGGRGVVDHFLGVVCKLTHNIEQLPFAAH